VTHRRTSRASQRRESVLVPARRPWLGVAAFIVRPHDTMISQQDAVKIAKEFVQARLPTCPVRLDSPFTRREPDGDRHRWVIMFERVLPPDVVQSPAEVIVLVDETSGTPEFELAL